MAARAMWQRVQQILSRPVSVEALRTHGVHLIAARAWREQGLPVPTSLREDERRASLAALAAPAVLARVRAAYDGRLMLMKGPEVAVRYPHPETRPFIDLDLLVDDPRAAQAALLDSGFVEVGERVCYEGVHHLRPLAWPGLPLAVELHREVNCPDWLPAPATSELLELAQPSALGVAGLRAPVGAAHAVLLAVHGWAHEPLRRLLDLIDVAVVLEDGDRGLAGRLAARWGAKRLWRTTLAAVDSLLYGDGWGDGDGWGGAAPRSWAARAWAPPRVWARHLARVRERTVFETHLARWAGPACGSGDGGARAFATATLAFAGAARPEHGEPWTRALARTGRAFGDAFRPQSQHNRARELWSDTREPRSRMGEIGSATGELRSGQ